MYAPTVEESDDYNVQSIRDSYCNIKNRLNNYQNNKNLMYSLKLPDGVAFFFC